MADLNRLPLPIGIRLPRGEGRLGNHPFCLLVEKGRQQNEFPVLELQPSASFGQTALADHDDLASRAQGLADHVPLLQGGCHAHRYNRFRAAGQVTGFPA